MSVLTFVTQLHSTQTDKMGEPYINHLTRVADYAKKHCQLFKKDDEFTHLAYHIALLHDSIEDQSDKFNAESLKDYGEPVYQVVNYYLTKPSDDKTYSDNHLLDDVYIEYLNNILACDNPLYYELAMVVKLSDLMDNMNYRRYKKPIDELNDNELERLLKYKSIYQALFKKLSNPAVNVNDELLIKKPNHIDRQKLIDEIDNIRKHFE